MSNTLILNGNAFPLILLGDTTLTTEDVVEFTPGDTAMIEIVDGAANGRFWVTLEYPAGCDPRYIAYKNCDAPSCRACGTPYSEHMGMTGLCRELMELKAQLAAMRGEA